jgi:hypothetical protein
MGRIKAMPPLPNDPQWRNLRDDKGRLYGRVNPTKLLLEIRSRQRMVTFDLKEYLPPRQPEKKE